MGTHPLQNIVSLLQISKKLFEPIKKWHRTVTQKLLAFHDRNLTQNVEIKRTKNKSIVNLYNYSVPTNRTLFYGERRGYQNSLALFFGGEGKPFGEEHSKSGGGEGLGFLVRKID